MFRINEVRCMEVKFVSLDSIEGEKRIYVNPALVRALRQRNKTQTDIVFDNDHHVIVDALPEEVLKAFAAA